MKHSAVDYHMNSNKTHKKNLAKAEANKAKDASKQTFIGEYVAKHKDNCSFTDITTRELTERLRLLSDWLTAGLPLESMTDSLRRRLEAGMGCNTGGISTLLELVPMLLNFEIGELAKFFIGGDLVTIFDAATKVAETLAIILGRVKAHKLRIRYHAYLLAY